MAHITATTAHFGLFDRVRVFFADLSAAAAARMAYDRTYRELTRLTDRELADIGLRRCDIEETCKRTAHI